MKTQLYNLKRTLATRDNNITAHTVIVLMFFALAASLLLTGIPPSANDRVYVQTMHELTRTANLTRPVTRIIVFGNAGTDAHRTQFCGGKLWVDHMAESLGADLLSFAHGYSVTMPRLDGDSRVMVGRPVHKKLPIGDVESQAETILEMSQGDADDRTLFVLVTDPSTEGESLQGAVRAANRLILDQRTHARRILLVDQPSSGHTVSSSNDLAKSLISDPSVDMRVYDSIGFLAKMQREHYKYGLRYPNHPCIYSETKRCKKPERFFWCDSSRVGSKAHFFMADDILRNHFVSAIVLPLY